MKKDSSEDEYQIAYFDVYAFSSLVSDSNLKEIYTKLEIVWNTIIRRGNQDGIRLFLFSDGGFALKEIKSVTDKDSIKEGELFIDFLMSMMDTYFENELLIRGWASFGKILCTDYQLLGIPVIECVKSELNIYAPYIFIPKKFISRFCLGMPSKPIKMKDGQYSQGCPLLPPPINNYLNTIKLRCENCFEEESQNSKKLSKVYDHIKETFPELFEEDKNAKTSRRNNFTERQIKKMCK
jgi:hypothetical protein